MKIESRTLSYLVNRNTLSFIFTGGSGDVFNEGSNRNLNGDATIPPSLQRPLFVGRNTIRGPSIAQLDLRYLRTFPIRERARAEFLAEFTNLFNHSNITGIDSIAKVDAAGNITALPTLLPTAALDPRLMQLGFRFTF